MVNWINVSQASGSGNATITVTAASYTELLERTTSLTVRTPSNSAVVGITQRYDSNFTVTPTQIINIPSSGGVYTLEITSDDIWYITGEIGVYDFWDADIRIGGTGTTTVQLTISANTGTSRNIDLKIVQGTIYDRGKPKRIVALVQEGAGGNEDTFSFTPHMVTISPQSHMVGFAVFSNGSWTLEAPDWITLSTYSGTGNNQSIVFTATQNDGADRTGSIIGRINGQYKDRIIIAQYGYNS